MSSDISWPTQEQFDQAHQHGTEYALDEIRAGNRTEARDAPLSGEWADDITTRQVARNVGFILPGNQDFDAVDELANSWEQGYFDAWANHAADKEDHRPHYIGI